MSSLDQLLNIKEPGAYEIKMCCFEGVTIATVGISTSVIVNPLQKRNENVVSVHLFPCLVWPRYTRPLRGRNKGIQKVRAAAERFMTPAFFNECQNPNTLIQR